MKAGSLTAALALILAPAICHGADLIAEDFDSYTIGNIHGQGPWKDFGGKKISEVSADRSYSGGQSLKLTLGPPGGGAGSDVYMNPSSKATSGKWELSYWLYLPSDYTGEAFVFASSGMMPGDFRVGSFVVVNGSGVHAVQGGSILGSAPLLVDQWGQVLANIDLDADTAEVSYNGTSIYSGVWNRQGGPIGIGGVNLWARQAWGTGAGVEGTSFYVDDFVLRPIPEPVRLLAALSRKTHGVAGDFDIDLPLDGAMGIESRSGGPTSVILTFSEPAAATDGVPDCSEVALSEGTCIDAVILDDEMTIELADAPDAACLTLTVSGIEGLDANPLEGTDHVTVSVLRGDARPGGNVDIRDMSRVKGNLFQTVTEHNFRADVNADGEIDVADMSAVKGNLFAELVCP